MNKRSHIHKKADSSASNPMRSQFQSRPFIAQAKPQSQKPLTQTETENQEFQQQKFEATKLELQAKYGTITPLGQERLTVLQAKMSGLLQRRLEHASRFDHNFANIPISRPDAPSQLAVQTKLTIGEPGDKYEQEADRVAAQVVNQINAPVYQQAGQNVQREEISEEEKDLQMKPMLQQRAAVGGMTTTADLKTGIQQARGGGQPLAAKIRQPMEQAFGADFSKVKVHTDTQADQLNQSIQAKAFTTGQDVFFRQGAYEPGSRGGQELVAHELTHVVQQSGGAVQRTQKREESGKIHSPLNKASGNGPHVIQRVSHPQAQEEAAEYTHIVLDKDNNGRRQLLESLNKNGLQTARTRNLSLAGGSVKEGHDRCVFMWDDTGKGRARAADLLQIEGSIKVRIRSDKLTKDGWVTYGTLKKDTPSGLGKGPEDTGAWAYEGDIERKYIYIEGIDKDTDSGYEEWKSGKGWPDKAHVFDFKAATRARK